MDAFGQFYASRITNKGFEAEIIKFRKGGTKRMGFGIFAVVKTKSGMDRGYFDIDKALRDGEIVSNVMTRFRINDSRRIWYNKNWTNTSY